MTEKQEQQCQKSIGFVKQLAEQHNALEVRVWRRWSATSSSRTNCFASRWAK